MDALFLSRYLRGLEETRNFTPALGQTVFIMLSVAVMVAGLLLIALPILRSRQPR